MCPCVSDISILWAVVPMVSLGCVSNTFPGIIFFIDLPSLSCPFSMHGGGLHLSSVTFLCNVPFIVVAGRGDGVGSVTLFSCVFRSAEGSRPVPSCSS